MSAVKLCPALQLSPMIKVRGRNKAQWWLRSVCVRFFITNITQPDTISQDTIMSYIFTVCLWTINILHPYCKTTDISCAYPSGAHEYTTGFIGIRRPQSLVVSVVLCRALFVFLSIFLWPIYCMSFELRFLVTRLISSTSLVTLYQVERYIDQ